MVPGVQLCFFMPAVSHATHTRLRQSPNSRAFCPRPAALERGRNLPGDGSAVPTWASALQAPSGLFLLMACAQDSCTS